MSDVMTVCAKLEEDWSNTIVARFSLMNPAYRGAKVEDIIDVLDNCDSNLDVVEKAWDDFPQFHKPGFGFAVRALHWSGTPITGTTLSKLLD